MKSDLELGKLKLSGHSTAGVETWFRVHPPGLAFDAGRGALHLEGAQDLFLSHGHLDHALGIPFVISQRSLHGEGRTRVFCPAGTADDLRTFIAAAERLEAATYDYELVALRPGERVPVGKDRVVEAFATAHGVPSLGYHLWQRRKSLKAELRGIAGAELAARRARGEAIEDDSEELALSYCGDTGAKVFELEPRIFQSHVLMLECTFAAPEHRELGRRFQHVHLDDLAERQDRFENRALVLHHVSRRYRPDDFAAEVHRRLPRLAGRVFIFGRAEGTP